MIEDAAGPTVFADMDRIPADMADRLIGVLEGMAAHPQIQRVRAVALEALRAGPGQRLLDAGCGAGEVARQLAERVAPTGEVLGLDYAAATVTAAAARHDGSAVRYVTGDVTALDLPDDSFDGVRCERVLQHLAEPDRAVAELVRVTRPGGRVCLVDTDWESVAVDGLPTDLVAAVRAHVFSRTMLHHVDMGRTLRRRLLGAGLLDVTAVPVALYFGDPDSAAAVLPMVNPLVPVEADMVPAELRERWFAAIAAAGDRGDFLATLTIWVVAGTVAPTDPGSAP